MWYLVSILFICSFLISFCLYFYMLIKLHLFCTKSCHFSVTLFSHTFFCLIPLKISLTIFFSNLRYISYHNSKQFPWQNPISDTIFDNIHRNILRHDLNESLDNFLDNYCDNKIDSRYNDRLSFLMQLFLMMYLLTNSLLMICLKTFLPKHLMKFLLSFFCYITLNILIWTNPT